MSVKPVAVAHITETDTYPDITIGVLDGEHLQPSMSPVKLYAKPVGWPITHKDWDIDEVLIAEASKNTGLHDSLIRASMRSYLDAAYKNYKFPFGEE